MPDEATMAPSADSSFSEAPAADTPNTAPDQTVGQGTTEPTPDADVINMRADYTRKTQELAEQRKEWEAKQAQSEQFRGLVENAFLNQDEEAAQAILQELGYEFDNDNEFDDNVDPVVSQLQQQLEELNSWKQEQESEAEARDNALHIEREFNRLGLEGWDDQNPAHNTILSLAFAHDTGEGPTNVQAGFDEYQKLKDNIIEEHKQSKLAPSNDPFGSPASAALPENASLEDRASLAIERNF